MNIAPTTCGKCGLMMSIVEPQNYGIHGAEHATCPERTFWFEAEGLPGVVMGALKAQGWGFVADFDFGNTEQEIRDDKLCVTFTATCRVVQHGQPRTQNEFVEAAKAIIEAIRKPT